VTGRVIVLAQDLIWADRLARAVQVAGAEPVRVTSLDGLEGALSGGSAAIIDLTALAYDGVAAIEVARAAGSRVLAVGQHDDHELRKRALSAGADRVYAYRKLFEDGPRTIEAWLARPAAMGA
jgi:DNA-binding response OmpR family regulator